MLIILGICYIEDQNSLSADYLNLFSPKFILMIWENVSQISTLLTKYR